MHKKRWVTPKIIILSNQKPDEAVSVLFGCKLPGGTTGSGAPGSSNTDCMGYGSTCGPCSAGSPS
jgi:hypothetical protein